MLRFVNTSRPSYAQYRPWDIEGRLGGYLLRGGTRELVLSISIGCTKSVFVLFPYTDRVMAAKKRITAKECKSNP